MAAVTSTARRADLDWIRVIAFSLLILYHVGMFYVPWDWHVKSPHPVEWLEPVMRLTSPWRLTLLFLVSGAATRFMADKLSVGEFTRARTARLLPPLLFSIFVIVPPQSYYELVEQISYSGSVLDFYTRYATSQGHWCDYDGCLITPTWNHMWFVAYLFAYSLILAALLRPAQEGLPRMERGLEGALTGAGLLVWPILFLASLRIGLAPHFPITHLLVDDWYNHALSFSAFLFGYLAAKSDSLRREFTAWRTPALLIALAAWAYIAGFGWAYRSNDAPPEALRMLGRLAYAVDQWAFIAAALGFGARYLTRDGPILRYLTLAVFPFYIIHQTVIVVAGHHLAKVGLPQAVEALVLVLITVGACFVTNELVRRSNLLRPLFGLKQAPPLSSAARRPE